MRGIERVWKIDVGRQVTGRGDGCRERAHERRPARGPCSDDLGHHPAWQPAIEEKVEID
jgi:hypothetical protein